MVSEFAVPNDTAIYGGGSFDTSSIYRQPHVQRAEHPADSRGDYLSAGRTPTLHRWIGLVSVDRGDTDRAKSKTYALFHSGCPRTQPYYSKQ